MTRKGGTNEDRTVRRLALFFGVAALCVLFAFPALASRIVYRDVSLRRALRRADVVVRAEAIALGNESRFRVDAVLRGTGLSAGEEITLIRPSAVAWGRVAQAYRQTGIRRSPIVHRLENTSRELTEGADYCLLLKPLTREGHWVSAVENGWVSAPCPRLARSRRSRRDRDRATKRSNESP